ncbi:MAG: LptF/LptG family permease, partial [Cyclobacteriaceae bacterium]
MKKLDKLILGSFLGPFLLTFIVVDFILLTVNMLKYFDEIFGKDLPFMVYMELIGYFVISISPMALPLAVLLSSLMTFGNLGEHFELTAIKSSGISLIRALRPIGVFVVFLTIVAFLSNNYLVPRVNLKTFSLLYDIRMKSPAFDIKEGVFYNGIPNYSIKVNKKIDEVRLQDVVIYDHTSGQGNLHLITADSGRMEPFFNDRYMMLTLYNGNSYQEGPGQRSIKDKPVTFN